MAVNPNIIGRDEARALGLKRFFTGRPCKRGHVAERGVSGGKCVECRHELRAANLEKARERDRENTRKYRAADPERVRENWRRWRDAHLEKAREGERLRHNKRRAAQRRAPDQSLTEPA
jgi:hypothetical protein